jgi:hypothetical protein
MRRYTAAPHPFVLRIDPRQSGSPYRLGLTLLGRADRHLPYFIHALAEAGKAGLGRKRRPFELIEVRQAAKPGAEDWRSIYAPGEPLKMAPGCVPETPPLPDWLEIRLETPLRLRSGEHLVTPADFRFAELFRPLLRRISMLTYFHTDTPLEADFAALGRSARGGPGSRTQTPLVRLDPVFLPPGHDHGNGRPARAFPGTRRRCRAVLALPLAGAMDPCRQGRHHGNGKLSDTAGKLAGPGVIRIRWQTESAGNLGGRRHCRY